MRRLADEAQQRLPALHRCLSGLGLTTNGSGAFAKASALDGCPERPGSPRSAGPGRGICGKRPVSALSPGGVASEDWPPFATGLSPGLVDELPLSCANAAPERIKAAASKDVKRDSMTAMLASSDFPHSLLAIPTWCMRSQFPAAKLCLRSIPRQLRHSGKVLPQASSCPCRGCRVHPHELPW
jgi:hypothetical protein